MDQLFFEPRAGLLPDLRGVLARAVLETQAGRKEFRARCATLFTNLFLTQSTSNAMHGERDARSPSPSPLNGERAGVRGENFTNLSNRVDKARVKLRPIMLAELDAKTARQAYEAATNLLYRIQERTRQLQGTVFATPEPRTFDSTGVARLTNWLASVEGSHVTFAETNSGGETLLEIRFGSSGKGIE
jgi:hypothetical protein